VRRMFYLVLNTRFEGNYTQFLLTMVVILNDLQYNTTVKVGENNEQIRYCL